MTLPFSPQYFIMLYWSLISGSIVLTINRSRNPQTLPQDKKNIYINILLTQGLRSEASPYHYILNTVIMTLDVAAVEMFKLINWWII